MKLRQRVSDAIATLSVDELALLYEQIRLLQGKKQNSRKQMDSLPIETVLDMTSPSESNWADAVASDRADRV